MVGLLDNGIKFAYYMIEERKFSRVARGFLNRQDKGLLL